MRKASCVRVLIAVMASCFAVPAWGQMESGSLSRRLAELRILWAQRKRLVQPTLRHVRYGPDPANYVNFWKAPGKEPTPVLIHIHGGGWRGGRAMEQIAEDYYLNRGISVVSVEYRLMRGQKNLLPVPVHDAARAVQFVRSKAAEWGIDPTRVALTGGSAGGCTSLWLAYHDDLADPDSPDPVARQSTKPTCAAVFAPQTAIDAPLVREWVGDAIVQHPMVWQAVGASSPEDVLANYEKYRDIAREFSPYYHVDKADPPVFMEAFGSVHVPAFDVGHGIHHPVLCWKLKQKADEVGAECHVLLRARRQDGYFSAMREFIEQKLLRGR